MFNLFQKCIKKFIAVPKNVLLEEDLCQKTQYSKKEFEKIERDLKNLQSQARKVKIILSPQNFPGKKQKKNIFNPRTTNQFFKVLNYENHGKY